MRRLRDISLRHKLTLIMLAASAAALLLASVAFVVSDTLDNRRELTKNLHTRAEILANATAVTLAFDFPEDATNSLHALRADPNLVAACLYDRRGQVFAQYVRPVQQASFQPPPLGADGAEFKGGDLWLFHEVTLDGKRLGTLFLQVDATYLKARFVRYLAIAGLVFVGAMAGAYLLSLELQRIVSRPILGLAGVARSVAKDQDYSLRAHKVSADELGQLYDDFNEMLVQISTRDVALRQAQDQLEERVRQRTAQLEAANRQLQEEIVQRQRAEKEIQLLAEAIRCSNDCVSITDLDDNILFANESFCRTYGYAATELLGRPITLVRPGKDATGEVIGVRAAALQGFWRGELVDCRKDGVEFPVWLSASCIRGRDGRPTALIGVAQDLTERKKLEEQLRQAQKMEAVGQLAAGVAHDFNNIMTVILGRASLLLEELAGQEEALESAREITSAAERAANLTRQLLAFSRKQVLKPRWLDLNEVLSSVGRLVARLLGEHIVIQCRLGSQLPWVRADAGMIEQVIVNLAVNARDAMPAGGQLTLATAAVELDARTAARNPEARPGRYVRLEVTDTGCGMDAKTLRRIFEPFFTTKDVGKGTGLGLATVHGIIKQHEGWIEVRSQVNQGTSFSVYLPATDETPQPVEEAAGSAAVAGKEGVLVAEDEPALGELVCLLLRRQGYHVWWARSGPEALEVWERFSPEIDVLLTDMVMPDGMTGSQLAGRLRAQKPQVKVIYTSGYSLELVESGIPAGEESNFLAKPYPADVLLAALRRVLNG